jgi:Tol biopolymer transport system component
MKVIVRFGLCIMVALLLLTVMPAAGTQGNGNSQNPSISADGKYVAFYSYATNLEAGDTNAAADIFVRDRVTGNISRVSKNSEGVEGKGYSYDPFISADGRYVAFESNANNLVFGDTNGVLDIFVRDRNTGNTSLVSRNSAGVIGNDASYYPTISADGMYVTFSSDASNLFFGDKNGSRDIFVRDRNTGATSRIPTDSAGVLGDEYSYHASISADGRYVAFESDAANLVPGDINGLSDIFVRDRQMGNISLVSRNTTDGVEGNGKSKSPSISSDGRFVTFESAATNLVAYDTNGKIDIFVRDQLSGNISRASRSSGGVEANGDSHDPSISTGGLYVAFSSDATNLVANDTNRARDIFVRERQTGTTYLISKI